MLTTLQLREHIELRALYVTHGVTYDNSPAKKSLRDHIRQVAASGDVLAKQQLIDTLNTTSTANKDDILNALSTIEKGNLKTLLSDPSFSDSQYEGLKQKVDESLPPVPTMPSFQQHLESTPSLSTLGGSPSSDVPKMGTDSKEDTSSKNRSSKHGY